MSANSRLLESQTAKLLSLTARHRRSRRHKQLGFQWKPRQDDLTLEDIQAEERYRSAYTAELLPVIERLLRTLSTGE